MHEERRAVPPGGGRSVERIARGLRLSLAALVLAAGAGFGLDPTLALTQYGHTAWRVRDGYFVGPPGALAQTKDGFLWIGTDNGLVRFDGVKFTPWVPPAGTRLPNDRIVALRGTRDGSLWIGTAQGLARWHDGRLTTYASVGRFAALLEDRDGAVWAGHTRSLDELPPLCRFRRGEFRCFRFAEEDRLHYVGSLVEDRKGRVWIGGEVGACLWRPEGPLCFPIDPLVAKAGKSGVFALAEDAEGNLWASSGAEGAWRLAAGRWTQFVDSPVSEIDSGPLLRDGSGSLWIGTVNDGLRRVVPGQPGVPGRVECFNGADGLSGDAVIEIFQDREGNVWVSTAGGLDRFRDVKVSTLTAREGLGRGNIQAVLASRDGSVWLAENRALLHWQDGRITSYGAAQGLPGTGPSSLFEDFRGRLWVSVDLTLGRWEGGRFVTLPMPGARPVGLVIAMAEDREGQLWIVTTEPSRTLMRIRGDRVEETWDTGTFGGAPVRALAADLERGIWVATADARLRLYRDGVWSPRDQLGKPGSTSVRALFADPRGLWAVTDRGLALLRDGTIRRLDRGAGLPCDDITSAATGADGSLWLKATCGLLHIEEPELRAWLGQPGRRVRARLFDALDGVQTGSAPFAPRSTRSRDGKIWFALESAGVQVVDPRRIGVNRVLPPVETLRLVADRRSYAPAPGLRLPPGTRDLEIDYTALSLTRPEKVRFRYRLEGTKGVWQEAGPRREAFFTNLGPGSYRFRVIACNDDGLWNEVGATLAFAILPAFYQTRWFLLLVAATLILLAWAVYRWRVRQVTSRLDRQFQERLAERTRIAQDLHDTLLQGLLSASLQLHVTVNEMPEVAPEKPHLRRVLALMGQVIDEGRNAVRGLRSPASPAASGDDLGQALSRVRQELDVPESVRFRVLVEGRPTPLQPLIRDEVYRIGREALVNAFRHSGAAAIEVEIEYSARALRVLVRDDGCGIAPEVLHSGRENHWGLSGMRERAEKLGARLRVWSGAQAGTEVDLTVPARIAFASGEPGSRPLWRWPFQGEKKE